MSKKYKHSQPPKKKKEKFVDNGAVIANMDVEGTRWHNRAKKNSGDKNKEPLVLTKKEKRRLVWEAYKRTFVPFLLILLGMTIVFLFMALWLN